jgi:hypothetical protein
MGDTMKTTQQQALEPIRFGEFLFEQKLISESQLLEALADHWSSGGRIGAAVARRGFLTLEQVEYQATIYHDLQVHDLQGIDFDA